MKLFLLITAVILIAGCTSEIKIDEVAVSSKSLAPLNLLSIYGVFNVNADYYYVSFYNDAYSVNVPVIEVLNNSLLLSVPPYIDNETYEFSSGVVDLQVIQVTDDEPVYFDPITNFTIKALPATNTNGN
jgi:hypothetical protein